MGTRQGPYQLSATGSRRKGYSTKSTDRSVENPKVRQRTGARSWDRSYRGGSISEGHQSPEEDGESKKKVDWCDPQWNGPDGGDVISTPESGHATKEAGTPLCVPLFVFLTCLCVIEPSPTQRRVNSCPDGFALARNLPIDNRN